jgi:hypothetical protein
MSEHPEHEDKPSNTGCFLLFIFALPLPPMFLELVSAAGPNSPIVLAVGLGGFACGAALGAYVTVKMRRPLWLSCRWAIYGCIGMFLLTHIALAVVLGRL